MATYPKISNPKNEEQVARIVNNAISGALNVVKAITLDNGSTTTTVYHPKLHPESFVSFMAKTDSASIAQSEGLKVVIANTGSAVIHHNAYTDTDMDFNMLIIG